MENNHFLGQPRAFYLIFFIEIWERFGFYGVQALLVLFMVQNLHFSDVKSDLLFTAFSALAYLYPALGGYIGDHLLGTKRTILIGAVILATGYLLLSFPFLSNSYLEFPLAVIAVGNGFFKANPSSLLSKVYEKAKVNQDGGFTLYYMAINIGSLGSFILAPILNVYFGWHAAFFCCFVGLLLAIGNYLLMAKLVHDVGSVPDFKPMRWRLFSLVIFGALLLIGVSFLLLDHEEVMDFLLSIVAAILLILFFIQTFKSSKLERGGMLLFIFLFFQGLVFWVMYFQMPTSLTLFALRNVQHNILGVPVQPAAFQGLDAFWIIVMSPILAVFYRRLSKHGKDFSMPAKFSLGTLFAGMAFVTLWIGCYFSRETGVLSSLWVVGSYWWQATGELLVSALGLSLASRYVPQRLMGYTMGLWFLSTSIGSIAAGYVASLANVPTNVADNPLDSLPIYRHLFMNIGSVTVILALIMFCFVPLLKRFANKPG